MIKLHNWGGDSEAVSVETIFSATKYSLVTKIIDWEDNTLLDICSWADPEILSLDTDNFEPTLGIDAFEVITYLPKQITNSTLDPMVMSTLLKTTERFLQDD